MARSRLSKIKIEWSPRFAYAIGLITTDGNLSPDGRHINLTSKDLEMINNFKNCLNLDNKIGMKARGGGMDKKYYVIQFGDKNFYDFLNSIGLTAAKSKTISKLDIPDHYFADFFRGCIDGDGNIGYNSHPESRHLQLKVKLFSASISFLEWIDSELKKLVKPNGGWIRSGDRVSILEYGKTDSIKILKFIYYNGFEVCLGRKYDIAKGFLN